MLEKLKQIKRENDRLKAALFRMAFPEYEGVAIWYAPSIPLLASLILDQDSEVADESH